MNYSVESFSDRVYALVSRIPWGRAASYGGVAAMLGHPRAARGVGAALSALPPDTDVPWWRVVNRDGRISYPAPGGLLQRKLLEREGVRFGPDERLDWSRHGWSPPDEPAGSPDLPPMTPVKPSISFAVFRPDDPEQVLVVRRPPDDEELPDLWGLPAGSLRPGESWEDAVRRAGREKLGVELDVGPELNRGSTPRAGYTLEMRLFEATIRSGEPVVPQPTPGVTQYREWTWADAGALVPAAGRGSLCCRLFLER